MTMPLAAPLAGGATPPATVRVWDPFVRIFHWSLVGLFAAAWATSENMTKPHVWIGYAIMALVVARIAWGFAGSRHARFSDFVRGPRAVFAYLRDMLHGRAPRFLGHNPAGGMMILALIAALGFTGLTGWLMTGPLWGDETIEELHEAAAFATLALVGLHVAGVIGSSLAHGENLVRAMITGRKEA
jgi:cytochrome b